MINLKSVQILILSYVGIIMLGAFLLSLPIMHHGDIDFFSAIFTSTSAFTCTGLIIKDTELDFSIYGKSVILLLIQLGGFGYMSMLGIFYVLLRKRLSNTERNLIKESLNYPTYRGMITFLKKTLIFVLIIEGIGSVILWAYFCYIGFDVANSFYAGLFHAISAFNNAGFSIFSTNLSSYNDSIIINIVICALIIAGGLGYIVLVEMHFFSRAMFAYIVRRYLWRLKCAIPFLSLHSKIVIFYTLSILIFSTLFIFLLEYHNDKSIGSFDFYHKLLSSFFMAVNYRTSGFNTIDLGELKDSTMFFSSLIMIIGGAPGGTAAGIKVTTLAVLFAFCIGLFSDKPPSIFNRQIAQISINKAVGIAVITTCCIVLANLAIAIAEENTHFMLILFEVCSAFATVGVSTGNGETLSLSANFTIFSKCIIILLMLMGKVGILAFWLAFIGKRKHAHARLKEERVIM